MSDRCSQAMRREHCDVDGESRKEFSTSNGMKGVTSEAEWRFVVDAKKNKQERAALRHNLRLQRKPVPVSDLAKEMENQNEKLRAAGHDEMIVEEVLAGRLYTGPMCKSRWPIRQIRTCSAQACMRISRGPSRAQIRSTMRFCASKVARPRSIRNSRSRLHRSNVWNSASANG